MTMVSLSVVRRTRRELADPLLQINVEGQKIKTESMMTIMEEMVEEVVGTVRSRRDQGKHVFFSLVQVLKSSK